MAQSPGINTINYLALQNPQFAAGQAQIQQQQQLAQQLIAQGSQQQDPAQLANPGGFVVPVSKFGALAGALQKGAGGYLQGKSLNDQQALYSKLATQGQSQQGQQLPWQGSMTPDDQAAAQQNQAIAAQLAPKAQSAPQSAMSDPQFMRDAMIVGPEKAYDGYLARNSPTNDMKNAGAAYGQGSSLASQALQQSFLKNFRPGSAYMGPDGVMHAVNESPNVVAANANAGGMDAMAKTMNSVQTGTVNGKEGVPYVVGTGKAIDQAGAFNVPNLNPMLGKMIQAESGGNPDSVSSAGAGGMTQIMPATAKDPGYGVTPLQGWDGKNPATAPVSEQVRFGNDYLNAMQAHNGGDPRLAAAAYNAGPGRVDAALANLPAETQAYVPKVAGPTPQPIATQPSGDTSFGIDPAMKAAETANATKQGDTLAENQKILQAVQGNLPYAMSRFGIMRDAAGKASSGYGIDEEGEGPKASLYKALPSMIGGETAKANAVLKQAVAQGALPEVANSLANTGIKGNKFIEQLSAHGSALDLADPPETKQATIDGLQRNFINGYRSLASQVRAQGGQAPSDEEINGQLGTQLPTIIKYDSTGKRAQ